MTTRIHGVLQVKHGPHPETGEPCVVLDLGNGLTATFTLDQAWEVAGNMQQAVREERAELD